MRAKPSTSRKRWSAARRARQADAKRRAGVVVKSVLRYIDRSVSEKLPRPVVSREIALQCFEAAMDAVSGKTMEDVRQGRR
jgi:hypothetical protein